MPDPNRPLALEHTLEIEGMKCQNPKSMEPEVLVSDVCLVQSCFQSKV